MEVAAGKEEAAEAEEKHKLTAQRIVNVLVCWGLALSAVGGRETARAA